MKLYNLISIFLCPHLLLSVPSISAFLLFLVIPPTISPLQRSLTYITLQTGPNHAALFSQRVCSANAAHSPPPSLQLSRISLSLIPLRPHRSSLPTAHLPPSSCIVVTLHSLATYGHKAVNIANEIEIISGAELHC